MLGAEQRLHPFPGEVFDLVDDRVAAVVPLAGIPLGVLVGEDRPGRGEHRLRREVLRRDQLQRRVLTLELAIDDLEKLRIDRAHFLAAEIGHVACLLKASSRTRSSSWSISVAVRSYDSRPEPIGSATSSVSDSPSRSARVRPPCKPLSQ